MLAAGTAWKLLDFREGIRLTLKGFCQQINGESFAFWLFSVTYNVSFIKIICISLLHRLKVFFLHFSWNSVFLHLKKILNIKLTAIFFYHFVLNILYYKLYDLQI